MSTSYRTLSTVRERSPFASPPRVLVVADDGGAGEALVLAEALDAHGAEAEVRLADDVCADHIDPDAVIVTGPVREEKGSCYRAAHWHPVLVAVAEGDHGEQARAAGFDLVVSRPVSAESLLKQLVNYLARV